MEVVYDSKGVRDRINLLSMTPTGIYDPFHIIDFLSRFSSRSWDKFCNVLRNFFNLWQIARREGQELGDSDVETFLLLVLVGVERVEVESALKQVVVIPPRTKVVEAKEEQLVLFCTEIDKFWSE